MNNASTEQVRVLQPLVFTYNEDVHLASSIDIRFDLTHQPDDYDMPYFNLYLCEDSAQETLCDPNDIEDLEFSVLPVEDAQEELPDFSPPTYNDTEIGRALYIKLRDMNSYKHNTYSFIMHIENIVLKGETNKSFILRVECNLGKQHQFTQTCRLIKEDFPTVSYSTINPLWKSTKDITVKNDFYLCYFNNQKEDQYCAIPPEKFFWYTGTAPDQLCGREESLAVKCSVAYAVGDDISKYGITFDNIYNYPPSGETIAVFNAKMPDIPCQTPYMIVFHFENLVTHAKEGSAEIVIQHLKDPADPKNYKVQIEKMDPDLPMLDADCDPDFICVESESLQSFELHLGRARATFYDPETEKDCKINIYFKYADDQGDEISADEKSALCTLAEADKIVASVRASTQYGWMLRRKKPDTTKHWLHFELIPPNNREPMEDNYFVYLKFAEFYSSVDIGDVEVIVEKENFRNFSASKSIRLEKKQGCKVKEFVSLPPTVLKGETIELSWNIQGPEEAQVVIYEEKPEEVHLIDSRTYTLTKDTDFELEIKESPIHTIYRPITVKLSDNWNISEITGSLATENNFDNRLYYQNPYYYFSTDRGIAYIDESHKKIMETNYTEIPYLCHCLVKTTNDLVLAYIDSEHPNMVHVKGKSLNASYTIDSCQKIESAYMLFDNNFYVVYQQAGRRYVCEFTIEDTSLLNRATIELNVDAEAYQKIYLQNDKYEFLKYTDKNIHVFKNNTEIQTINGAKQDWFSILKDNRHIYYIDEQGISTDTDFNYRYEGSCIPFQYINVPMVTLEDQTIKYLVCHHSGEYKWINKKIILNERG